MRERVPMVSIWTRNWITSEKVNGSAYGHYEAEVWSPPIGLKPGALPLPLVLDFVPGLKASCGQVFCTILC